MLEPGKAEERHRRKNKDGTGNVEEPPLRDVGAKLSYLPGACETEPRRRDTTHVPNGAVFHYTCTALGTPPIIMWSILDCVQKQNGFLKEGRGKQESVPIEHAKANNGTGVEKLFTNMSPTNPAHVTGESFR